MAPPLCLMMYNRQPSVAAIGSRGKHSILLAGSKSIAPHARVVHFPWFRCTRRTLPSLSSPDSKQENWEKSITSIRRCRLPADHPKYVWTSTNGIGRTIKNTTLGPSSCLQTIHSFPAASKAFRGSRTMASRFRLRYRRANPGRLLRLTGPLPSHSSIFNCSRRGQTRPAGDSGHAARIAAPPSLFL